MAEETRVGPVPRTAIGVVMLTALVVGVLAYMTPTVLTPLFLGVLLFAVLIIYLVTDFLVSRHILPRDYLYLSPLLILGVAFIMAGLAQKGYLPMAMATGNTLIDLMSTTLLYAIVIAAAAGVAGFIVYYMYYRPRAAKASK